MQGMGCGLLGKNTYAFEQPVVYIITERREKHENCDCQAHATVGKIKRASYRLSNNACSISGYNMSRPARILGHPVYNSIKNVVGQNITYKGNFLVKDLLMTPSPPLGVKNVKIRENSEKKSGDPRGSPRDPLQTLLGRGRSLGQ